MSQLTLTLGTNMKITIAHYASILAVALLAAGCSSKPTAQSILKQEAALQEGRDAAAARRIEARNDEGRKQIARLPDWVTSPPRADGEFVYAVGSGVSARYDLARQKAVLGAEFNLAKQYKQALSGSEQMYQRDNGGIAGAQERYTLLIDRLVDRVHLVGQEVVSSEAYMEAGRMQVWVLVKLSFDELERVLARQRSASVNADIDAQFEKLELRLQQYRKETAEAAPVASAVKPSLPPEATQAASDPQITSALPR